MKYTMRNIKIQCLIILIIQCCQYSYAQDHDVEISKIFIETSSGFSEICHEAHNHDHGIDHNIAFRPEPDSAAAFIRNNGLFQLGSADVCIRNYQHGVFLAVEGDAVKEGDAMWESISDKRLKRNIQSLENSTEKFMNIKFYSYEYKRTGKMRYGIMAQEVKEDFPHSIGTFEENGVDYYTFNPNNLFFTGMKVIQENSGEIRTLEAENQRLRAKLEAERNRNNQQQTEIDAIKAALANQGIELPSSNTTEAQPKPTIPSIRNHSRLEQNIPNPFSQSTIIPYYLPDNTQTAILVVRDMTGKTIVKHILPTQKGEAKVQVDIDNAQLRGGMYTYSLYANEQLVDTKKMTLLTK